MATSKTWNGSNYSIPASGERNWPSLSDFLSALADGAQTTGLQKVGMRVATSSPVTVSASSDCIVVVALSSPGAVTVNLPAGTTGQWFAIADGTGDAATNNITVTPASGLINGAATYVIGKNRAGIIIAYNGTSWTVVAEFTSESSTTGSITIKDANFTVQDDADPTKQFKFQASGITAGQTRTFTVPDASTTMVGTDTAQTLTNKTIDADQNTITNIENADIKSGAAIAHNKLADITAGSVLMGNGSNVPTATALSGDVTVNSSGVTAIGAGKVTNAMLATATNANTAGAVVARDGSGNFSAGTITASLSGNATNVTGTVAIANGGTGQTTANAAINALLPSQATHTGKALTTNGTDTQWTTVDSAALSQYHVKVGDSGGTAAPVNTNSVGDILADSTGGLTIKSGVIVNADVNASAAIEGSKIQTSSASNAGVVTMATGSTTSTVGEYEYATNTVALSGATTSPNVTARFVRVGKIVTMTVPAIANVTKDGSAGALSLSSLIPTAMRPTGEIRWISYGRVNNTVGDNMFLVTTTGTFAMYHDIDLGTNIAANTTNCGWSYDIVLSWVL